MSDKFEVPNLPGATGERGAETEEGSDSRGRSALYRDNHLGEETECEEWDSDEDEETEAEETDCNSRYGEDTEYDGSPATDADADDEEVTHPDAPNPPAPDLQEIAEIVAAAVETATAPLIAQAEAQQQAIDELTTAIGAIDIEQAIEDIEERSESAITRLGGMCDKLDSTLSHAQSKVRAAILSNESAVVQRQRAMMNLFLARSSMDKRDAAIKEFCTSNETIETHGIETQILVNSKPWAFR